MRHLKRFSPLTPGQVKELLKLFKTAILDYRRLTNQRVQLFLSNGDEIEEIKRELAALVEKYFPKSEYYDYVKPRDYRTPKPDFIIPKNWTPPSIQHQKNTLNNIFPGIDLSEVNRFEEHFTSQIKIPRDHNSGFMPMTLIVKLSAMGRLFGIADPYYRGYNEIRKKIFEF